MISMKILPLSLEDVFALRSCTSRLVILTLFTDLKHLMIIQLTVNTLFNYSTDKITRERVCFLMTQIGLEPSNIINREYKKAQQGI